MWNRGQAWFHVQGTGTLNRCFHLSCLKIHKFLIRCWMWAGMILSAAMNKENKENIINNSNDGNNNNISITYSSTYTIAKWFSQQKYKTIPTIKKQMIIGVLRDKEIIPLFQGRPAAVGSTWRHKNINNRTTKGHHTATITGITIDISIHMYRYQQHLIV